MIATVPAVPVANLAFSPIGNGAATRAGSVVAFLAIAFIGFRLIQTGAARYGSQSRASAGAVEVRERAEPLPPARMG
jgi:ABC-type Na+ efflux pump permease subunit